MDFNSKESNRRKSRVWNSPRNYEQPRSRERRGWSEWRLGAAGC